MKLTICIPVYNFDVNLLVTDLNHQIVDNNLDVDIVLIDDASDEKFIKINKDLEKKVSLFVYLDKNVGRSKIRNLFLNYTNSNYLLFLDCDGKIISANFLKSYITYLENNNGNVIFGGRVVSATAPNPNYGLRWRFATERENLPVQQREKSPYTSFQTNNFVVKRNVLQRIPFNENILQYGYEDLVFAKDLSNHQVAIEHVDNPIYNDDVESNIDFLSKADQSAKSLAQLIKMDRKLERVSQIKLAKAYIYLEKTKLIYIYKLFYKILRHRIEKKLLSGNASLKILDLYKLGQLIGYMNK